METPDPRQAPAVVKSRPSTLRERIGDATRFWEPRRAIYNVILTAVVLVWLVVTWPHFRPALSLSSLLPTVMLALMANVCYCAAYFVDIPLQGSALRAIGSRQRWVLWALGTAFAIVLENYWIADEIYPSVR